MDEPSLALERSATREATDAEISRAIAREAYLTPLLMLLVGGGVTCGVIAWDADLATVGASVFSYVISVPVGVGVFLLCCLLWIGFDAPIPLTALRLAGIYAVTDATRFVVGFVPYGGIVLWIVPLGVYIGLLSQMLEIEIGEAAIVGVLTFMPSCSRAPC